MDEQRLKDILGSEEVPPADENARKAAINLALAAFDEVQQEKQNRRQGFRLWHRLTGRSNSPTGRRPMTKPYVFGGMATAMALILSLGIYNVLDDRAIAPRATSPDAVEVARGPEPAPALRALEDDRKLAATAKTDRQSAGAPGIAGDASQARGGEIRSMPAERQNELSKQGSSFRRDGLSEAMRAPVVSMQPASPASRVAPVSREAPIRQYEAAGRDRFENVEQNGVKRVAEEPVSTFSVDVDTASYAFVRRMLNRGVLPQKNAVRIEELINYFDYDYPLAASREQPFRPTVTVMPSPWKAGNRLVHIGIKGYDLEPAETPRSNLVFLLDVSGSMNAHDKLPLVVSSMKLLLEKLKPDDTVAIVVYAGAAGTVLEPTKVAEKQKILAALDRLHAGGSTAGAAGVRQAYALAEGNFDKSAVNRVILATDGDFNVGITDREELKSFIERKRKSGIFLSVLGFGQGNLNDHLMQTLAQNGNGTAAHIDTLNEARKVLVEEASSTLFPIAKDVKIQVEFNPKTVAEYRLIGYETRALKREDFRNDKVDAGDIGAGHAVTAIYEITPVGGESLIGETRYQPKQPAGAADRANLANEYAFLKIRYKLPGQDTSNLISVPITKSDEATGGGKGEADRKLREARWATAVAAFGQILKGGKYTGSFSYDDVIALARASKGDDEFGYRTEFINLVRLARSASPGK